jgi:hypothetical protein
MWLSWLKLDARQDWWMPGIYEGLARLYMIVVAAAILSLS